MDNSLELTWEKDSSPVPVLRLKGRLDSSSSKLLLNAARSSLQLDGATSLVIDLANLEFVASTGLASFLLLTEEFNEVKGIVVLANATPPVMKVISLLNIDQFLNLANSEDEAFSQLCV